MQKRPILQAVVIIACALLKYAPAIISSVAELLKVLQ